MMPENTPQQDIPDSALFRMKNKLKRHWKSWEKTLQKLQETAISGLARPLFS